VLDPFVREAYRLLRENQPAKVLALLKGIRRKVPDDEVLTDLAAQALLALERHDDALKALEQAIAAGAPPVRLLTRAAHVHASRADRPRMRETFLALRARADGSTKALLRAYSLEAQLHRQLGDMNASLSAYEQAYRLTNSVDALRGVASTAERLGRRRRALQAYAELCRQTASEDACKRKDRLTKRPSAPGPSVLVPPAAEPSAGP
jgi:tetratricopeptide (TPR) repeat protein